MNKDYKDTQNKLPLNLIPAECYTALGEVLQYGLDKYGVENEGSYKNGEHETYESALLRHLVAYKGGEWKDNESELSHLKHILFNAMALVYIEERDSLESEYNYEYTLDTSEIEKYYLEGDSDDGSYKLLIKHCDNLFEKVGK